MKKLLSFFLVGIALLLMSSSAYATPMEYLHPVPGQSRAVKKIYGDLDMYESTRTAITNFEVHRGSITKVASIKFLDGTVQTTATGGTGSGDALLDGNNTWTGRNDFDGEIHTSQPFSAEAGTFTTAITRYGTGALWLYTIGDQLRTDTTNFYLSDGRVDSLEKKTIFISSPTAGINPDFSLDGPVTFYKVKVLVRGGTSAQGTLQIQDANGVNAQALSWNTYTASTGVQFSTATFRTVTTVDGSRVQWQTTTVTGTPSSMTVDIWYKRQ